MPPIQSAPHNHTLQPGEAGRMMRMKAACDESGAPCAKYSSDQLIASSRRLGAPAADEMIDRATKLNKQSKFAGKMDTIVGVAGVSVMGLGALGIAGGLSAMAPILLLIGVGAFVAGAVGVYICSVMRKRTSTKANESQNLLTTFV